MRAIRSAVAVALLLAAILAFAQTVSTTEASKHLGERVTVCGQAASVHYARTSRGQPTFINLHQPRQAVSEPSVHYRRVGFRPGEVR